MNFKRFISCLCASLMVGSIAGCQNFDKTNTGYCKTSVNAPNTKNTNNVITKYNK